MQELISTFDFGKKGKWSSTDDDAAVIRLGRTRLVFTTDSFIVDPLFFQGGDIGHLAFCGTVNDLLMMGAEPLGLSLAFIIEEGFPRDDLGKIVATIRSLSEGYGIPIVTGDTKVMERGKVDKIVINTSGVGVIPQGIDLTKPLRSGDSIIVSGGIGEHAVAILQERFGFDSHISTDSRPLVKEMKAVRADIKAAKDPTRGGIASALNEISLRHKAGMVVWEEEIPAKKEVRKAADMLGIGLYELACEGRFICIAEKARAKKVLRVLKRFNKDARIIGEVSEGDQVVVKTRFGSHMLPMPSGRIVPRIC